jgi:hypothetical protein
MREIEAEINRRRGEEHLGSEIPLTNFRGIELRDFPAEIARLALIIAEFQCDVLYRGQQDALAEFLPLDAENWIVSGNALRLDWLSICPAAGTGVKVVGDDLFNTPVDQKEIDFENEGGETYICGNPPYLGSVYQSEDQKSDMKAVFDRFTKEWKSLDYVTAWFQKAVEYGSRTKNVTSAFVATNSICQGEQVPILWPLIFNTSHSIVFAYRSFKWSNLASNKAGVTVVVVGVSTKATNKKRLFDTDESGVDFVTTTENIGPYLISGPNISVLPQSSSSDSRGKMIRGNMSNDGGHLVLSESEMQDLLAECPQAKKFIKAFVGSKEFITALPKYCIWIEDENLEEAMTLTPIAGRVEKVRQARLLGGKQARDNANTPHRFVFAPHKEGPAILVPRVSSEHRQYLPVGVTGGRIVVSERNFVLYDTPLWNMSLIASRLHWVWIGTVCVRLEMRFSYSNTLGWNTFPIPLLTDQNKIDLTTCAETILLAREAHFPATIADLYEPDEMPANLRLAHEINDEVIERIYIGRRFKNDTERLEKLFELYTKMTANATGIKKGKK